ncbi:MAG TPA: Si-specific NAD(P)(+) transhydrogenase [Thermoanaerobaculaceae bacterium]|nr:Si-specific NAD(P)(+) transhydrogenase [Thermoanaerobaculaceae bacterium]
MRRYDVIVIGCGPGGERAAIQAARAGKQVAVIERQHVLGGTRVNWGTIPSKTLRESALFVHSLTRNKLEGIRCEIRDEITVHDFMYRERQVVQRELELINESLERYRIEVFVGQARFIDSHTVAVCGPDGGVLTSLAGDFVVIATGSSPNRPSDVPFDGESVFDSNTILGLPHMPKTMIVLGAGVIGIEFACMFSVLGIEVTLVDTRDKLLPYVDREIVAILEREMGRLGINLLHNDRHASIERLPGDRPRVRCTLRHGGALESDSLLYCVGRDGNTKGIGLELLGLEPNDYGLLTVNENFQTAVPHIYAVGDVIGYPALASTSMEQGRQAMRHAFNIPGLPSKTETLPFAIYSIPEVSYIGETEEGLQGKGVEYVVGRGDYDMNPRGQIIGDTGGMLKLLFEAGSMRLVGAHQVGHGASELIHIAQAFLRAGASAFQIAETLYNYPTLADLYRHASLKALLAVQRQEAGGSERRR